MKKIVGIITYNRSFLLEECIESLNEVLGDSRSEYHIVVSDDGSQDDSKILLEQCLENKTIDHFILGGRGGVAKNSNRIINYFKAQEGDILFLCNDDITFLNNPFSLYEQALEKSGVHHLCYNDPKSPNKPSGSVVLGGISFTEYYLVTDGVFLVLDKFAIETLGGFNPEYGLFSVEHIDLSHRASIAGLTAGYRILDVDRAEGMIRVNQYYHTVPPSLKNQDAFKVQGREVWQQKGYLNPKIYEEI